jgi:starch synthase (maltosyl-transferring)
MAETKIALCITDLDVGGAEQMLVALATGLDRSRFAPVVYCLAPEPQSLEASCIPPLQAAGLEVVCLGARRLADFPAAVGRLKRHFLQSSPDLVQTFLFHANIVGRMAARRAGVPATVCGLRVAERHCRWHLWVDGLTARWVDRYVCVSQSVAEFSIAEAGLPPERLVVIPNGVDLERYASASPASLSSVGVPTGSRVVTFIGRLEPQKGVAWLLESATLWLPRLPDCHLVLVGQGPDRPALERLALDRGITERVHWLGWRSDIPEVLAATDLLVLPSRWEGMPNVVLQAMASRRPVLATDVEGVRELLGDNWGAQTVVYGDTAGLADKLGQLLSDRELAERLGRENRQRSERMFSIPRMVAAYQDLWASILAGRI